MEERRHGRLAHRCADRIRRYRQSDVRRRLDGVCRFHPSCSEYALEAFEEKRFLVALGMTTSRLLRCNPLVRRVTRDPVARPRPTPRPGTVRTLSLVAMLAGFTMLFLMGGPASADPPTGGCTGSANGRNAAGITKGDPLVVKEHDQITAQGNTPPGKSGKNHTSVKVILIDPIGGVTSEDHEGNGDTWSSSTVEVDDYLKYGVGLYKVEVTNTGPGWKCTFVGYIKLDGNPLTKPVGAAAAGVIALGAVGGLTAPRKKPSANIMDSIVKEGDKILDAADADRAAQTGPPPGMYEHEGIYLTEDEDMALHMCLGCVVSAILLPARAMPIVGMGGGAGVMRVKQVPAGPVLWQRRFWSHGRPIIGFLSGLLFGLGASVLLQQYGVWLLNIVTAIVLPILVGVAFGVYAYIGKPYKLVAVGSGDLAPPPPVGEPDTVGPVAWQEPEVPAPAVEPELDDEPPPPAAPAADDEPEPPTAGGIDDEEPPPPAV